MQTTDSEISTNVACTIGIGSGNLTGFSINGKLVVAKLEWERYIVIDSNYGGLICDDKVIQKFTSDDTWSVEQETVNGTCLNCVVTAKIENVEELKRKTAKKDKVINI